MSHSGIRGCDARVPGFALCRMKRLQHRFVDMLATELRNIVTSHSYKVDCCALVEETHPHRHDRHLLCRRNIPEMGRSELLWGRPHDFSTGQWPLSTEPQSLQPENFLYVAPLPNRHGTAFV